MGGWYDIFLPWMLEDFAALQAAGRRTQLIIGPWTHTAPGLMAASLKDGVGWLRAHLLGDDRLVPFDAVRVFVTGDRPHGGWRSLETWPPQAMRRRQLWLAPERRLGEREPEGEDTGGDRYRYDPDDPTPSLGGPVLLAREPVVDNRSLETRPDVLVYTGDPLPEALEAIGPVSVELWVRTSSPYFDLFARVCDVDSHGVSRNVCDALQRVVPEQFEESADGSRRVAFDLWPTAHRFAAGHRIRLQVSSGAHPRYARNPGTGEDPVTGTRLQPVDVELLHDGAHPSALILPG
jgi:putative CocE/NonD family hydrolase